MTTKKAKKPETTMRLYRIGYEVAVITDCSKRFVRLLTQALVPPGTTSKKYSDGTYADISISIPTIKRVTFTNGNIRLYRMRGKKCQ